jgi:probable addiction module antidote protein
MLRVEMSDEEFDQAKYRDNPEAIARYLSEKFAENDFEEVLKALSSVLRAQNVKAFARATGLRREGLYRTFDGEVNVQLGRVMQVLEGLGVRFMVTPVPNRERPSRRPKTRR